MKNKIMTGIDLSVLAYEEAADVEAHVKNDFDSFKWIENKETDTQGFIVRNDDGIWNTFRGTEFTNLEDWLTNLDCRFRYSPWGLVHKGFRDDAESVDMQIMMHLEDLSYNGELYIGGHSQGGGVAEQYTGTLLKRYLYPFCIAVAPPRSYSHTAAKKIGGCYGERFYQIINNNDVVPRVPTGFMGFSHIHDRHLRYIDESGVVHETLTPWERFKDRVHGRIADIGEWGSDGIKDHSPQDYQRLWRATL